MQRCLTVARNWFYTLGVNTLHNSMAIPIVLLSVLWGPASSPGISSAMADLVAYYPFESSAPLRDASGNGRTLVATETSNVTFQPGVFGDAAVFPGISLEGGNVTEDDFLILPMDLAPDFGTGDMSVSLWYRRNNPQEDEGTTGADGGPDGIYDSLNGTTSGYQLFLLADGRVNGRFDTEDGGFVVVNSEGPSNLEFNDDDPELFAWHHITYTVDRVAEEALLYVNGELADFIEAAGDSLDLFEANITPSQDLNIGRANEHGADGAIDDMAFFDHVLTEQEVADLFAMTLSPADFVDSVLGDFDADGLLTAADINLLAAAFGQSDPVFDLDGSGTVNQEDHQQWVEGVFGTFLGDADLNRRVEFADFLLLSGNFGQDGGWAEGDFDGNGTVEFADFLSLSGSFGRSAEVASVPEPETCLPCVFILGAMLIRRHKHSA